MGKIKKLSDFVFSAKNQRKQNLLVGNEIEGILFKMRYFHFILLIYLMVVSCSTPLSKESYLKKFDTFVSEISSNHESYSGKDWAKKTERYEKFSGDWYEKFKDDFTWQEKLKITGLKTKYQYYRVLSQSSVAIKELLNTLNIKEIREKVQFYIKNDMENDLSLLYEEACKAGGAAEKAVMEILKELQVNIEELKK